MTFNVLVIPEDSRTDGYIVGPVMSAAVQSCGRPNARVRVLTDPILGGIHEALKLNNLREIVDRYPLVNLFVLVVDRDDDPSRRGLLDQREGEVAGVLKAGQGLIAVEAWQEVEAWGLAGQDLPTGVRWSDIRAERDVKERFFSPYVRANGLFRGLGGGRKSLGDSARRNYGRVRSRCPELRDFEQRVAAWIQEQGGA
jgi:hypothetical protein